MCVIVFRLLRKQPLRGLHKECVYGQTPDQILLRRAMVDGTKIPHPQGDVLLPLQQRRQTRLMRASRECECVRRVQQSCHVQGGCDPAILL